MFENLRRSYRQILKGTKLFTRNSIAAILVKDFCKNLINIQSNILDESLNLSEI